MKVLLTGAAGFIGSHVAEALLLRGHHVTGLDNLNDYYPPARKRANLREVESLETPGSFEFRAGDIRDRALLSDLFTNTGFEAVVHLAAMAGVRISMEQPALYFDVNLNGTLALLDHARDHGTGNFVLASTSSVYGATQKLPFEESDCCDRPLAPYPASKRAAEMLGFTYHHLYGLNVTALRFFTVYGPRGRPDMMAYKVLDSTFFDHKVPLYDGGQMWRDWTYVGDIAQGIAAASERPLGYEVINLGRGEPVLLNDFVDYLQELTGRPAKLHDEPKLDADINYTYADISKARRLLDYEPAVGYREGVFRFWKWYEGVVLQSPQEITTE